MRSDDDSGSAERLDAGDTSPSSQSGTGGFSSTNAGARDAGSSSTSQHAGSVSKSTDAALEGGPGAALDAGSDGGLEAGTSACRLGYADCNGDPADGCEVEVTTDPANCGTCHHGCSTNNAATVACNAGRCEPTCSVGYADCNGETNRPSDDGCETNLNAGTTCGGCDHDCQGGTCSNLHCQPVTLASGLNSPSGLAVDSRYVHWSDQTGGTPRIMRATLYGKSPTLVASDIPISSDNPLVSNGDYVVWATQSTASSSSPPNGAIKRVHSGDNDVTAVVSDLKWVTVAVDAAHVYWSDEPAGTLHEASLDGLMARPIANAGAYVFEMTVDSTNLYFTQATGALGSMNLSSDAVVQVTPTVPGVDPYRLAADGSNLYVWASKIQATEASDLLRMPKSLQGKPVVIATHLPTLGFGLAIAADVAFVYFAGNDGLYRVPSSGGTATRLAPTTSPPAQIVVAGGVVYWLDPETGSGNDGALRKLAVFPK